jgi:hypothetical protein
VARVAERQRAESRRRPYLIVAHRPVGNYHGSVSWLCNPKPQASAHDPGIVRHIDLGRAGGGHTDPTEDLPLWRSFIKMVNTELQRGGFRATWGKGRFKRIDV